MSYLERNSRRRPKPPRSSLDLLREAKGAIQIGGGSLSGDTRGYPRQPIAEETDWGKEVAGQVFPKKTIGKGAEPGPFYGRYREIKWDAEDMDNYDNSGGLGIIFYFVGIEFTDEPFQRSRHDKPDSRVFYTRVKHDGKSAHLFMGTEYDMLEFQIALGQMDDKPLIQETSLITQLREIHDPASMTISHKGPFVIVGYNLRTS